MSCPQPGFALLSLSMLLRTISDPWNPKELQPNKDSIRPTRTFKAQNQEILSQDRQTQMGLCLTSPSVRTQVSMLHRAACPSQLFLASAFALQTRDTIKSKLFVFLQSAPPHSLPPLPPCSESSWKAQPSWEPTLSMQLLLPRAPLGCISQHRDTLQGPSQLGSPVYS